jgi:hypothetical protein
MAVVEQYLAFRHHFAQVARTQGVSLTYTHGINPGTIARASGSFVDDGFEAGMSLDVIGTTDNDARYTIATVAAGLLTLSTGQQFNSTETITSSLVGARYELDGMERWPIALVRANGFDDGATPSKRPFTPFPVTLTVNGDITDVAAGTSYTWYVSQRTDTGGSRGFVVTHPDSAKTGTIQLSLTARAVADLGIGTSVSPLNAGQRQRLLKHCYAFVQRASDKAIQIVDLANLSEIQTI